MKLYLAGPMRGIPEWNFPAFREAAQHLRDLGYTVYSPAERDEEDGFKPDVVPVLPRGVKPEPGRTDGLKTFREYMHMDLGIITGWADAVAVLPGWEDSQGAALEAHVAEAIDLNVYLVEDLLSGAQPRYQLTAKGIQHVEQRCTLPPGHDEPCEDNRSLLGAIRPGEQP